MLNYNIDLINLIKSWIIDYVNKNMVDFYKKSFHDKMVNELKAIFDVESFYDKDKKYFTKHIKKAVKSYYKEHMPYRHLHIDTAEADDIIAVLCKQFHDQKILILSGDKDFIQLHNKNVQQYNPVLNKFVGKDENPSIYIKEHILKGDRSDGIPNVLSDDNVFIEGRRQRPLTKKKIESWVNEMVMTFTEEEQKNYDRNRQLIDLSLIPPALQAKIYNEFTEVKVAHRSKILNYFITRKLKTLIEVIDEF